MVVLFQLWTRIKAGHLSFYEPQLIFERFNNKTAAMHLRISISLLVFLFILGSLSPAMVEGFRNGATPMYSLDKDGGLMKMDKIRKLIVPDAILDYDDAGANRRHDPRGKKPGNGGDRNP